jgi:hypothetical protein
MKRLVSIITLVLILALCLIPAIPAMAYSDWVGTLSNFHWHGDVTNTSASLAFDIAGDTDGDGASLNWAEVAPIFNYRVGTLRGTWDTKLADGEIVLSLELHGDGTYVFQINYGNGNAGPLPSRMLAQFSFTISNGILTDQLPGAPDEGYDKGFLIESINATGINIDEAIIGTVIRSMGAYTDMTVSIDWWTGSEAMQNVQVANNVVAPGEKYYAKLTGLDGATTYKFKGKATDGTHTFYSKVNEFTTINPNQPPFLAGITAWFGSNGFGTGAWWILFLIFNLIIWWKFWEHKWVGTICTIISLGAMVAFSLIDVWILAIMGIVLGFVGYGLVFRRGS